MPAWLLLPSAYHDALSVRRGLLLDGRRADERVHGRVPRGLLPYSGEHYGGVEPVRRRLFMCCVGRRVYVGHCLLHLRHVLRGRLDEGYLMRGRESDRVADVNVLIVRG